MTVTATYYGEEVEVTFIAQTERSDYGVPGSPVWDEVIDSTIEVYTLSILGVDIALDELPKPIQKQILNLADECEFEAE